MPMDTDGLKALPRDEHKLKASRGSNSVVFLNETNSGITTGSFQEILLPANTECKSIMIQVHNGIIDDFTSYGANPAGFHFSTTGHATNKDYTCHVGSHVIDIGKKKDASLGYVRAAASQYVVVEVIE